MLNTKILVVEDEEVLALDIRNRLDNLGYSVSGITHFGEEAIEIIAVINPNIVLIDLRLARINGVQIVEIIKNTFQVPVLYLTEYSELKKMHKRLREPYSYIPKPFVERDLHVTIEMALCKHKIERRLQEEKRKFMSILNGIGCAVVVTDANSYIQMMNPVAEALTAWRQDEAVNKNLVEVLHLVEKDTGQVIEDLAKQVVQVGVVLNLPENFTLIAKDGTEIQVGGSVAPIHDDDGNTNGTVVVFQDITQRKKTEAQLVRNAFYDQLTALPNRVLFQERLRQAFERGKRRNNYRYAVLFLDLDGFKRINDNFGHSMGDDLLVAIARRLESCLRIVDTVARFGGDEFVVLIEDIKDVADATNVAKRIQETLQSPLQLNGHQILIAASIGIVLSSSDYNEPKSLLRDADIAMYHAKKQGKARYVVFNFQQSLMTKP